MSTSFEAKPRPTPAEYFRATNLVQRVEATLNDCYAAQPLNPLRFVADRLRDGCENGLIDEMECALRLDGSGGTAFVVRVALSNGIVESVSVRTVAPPIHPTTLRTTLGLPKMSANDAASRAAAADALHGVLSAMKGCAVASQSEVDRRTMEADGTDNFAAVGSSVAAAVSLAACIAGARLARQEIFTRIAALADTHSAGTIAPPLPVIALFGCGESRNFGRTRLVEVCFVPSPAVDTATALRQAAKLHETLSSRVDEPGQMNVDGSLRHVSPDSLQAAVDAVEDAMREDGLVPGTDAFIGVVIDAAWCFKADSRKYAFSDALGEISGAQLAELVAGVCRDRPSVTYIEDALHPSDKAEARRLMSRVGGTVSVCSVNNLGANAPAAAQALADQEANTVGVRLEDSGSVTGALAVLKTAAGRAGCVTSVAVGALASPACADFAVGAGARYLRAGGLGRGAGAAIYNRLADIDAALRRTGMYSAASGSPHAECALPEAPAEAVAEVQATDKKKKK